MLFRNTILSGRWWGRGKRWDSGIFSDEHFDQIFVCIETKSGGASINALEGASERLHLRDLGLGNHRHDRIDWLGWRSILFAGENNGEMVLELGCGSNLMVFYGKNKCVI